MIISTLEGGLGNQVFQYAAGRSVMHRTGKAFFLDRAFYNTASYRKFGLNAFSINAVPLWNSVAGILNGKEPPSKLKRFVKKYAAANMVRLDDAHEGYDPRLQSVPGHCRLSGYWQSEKYFAAIRGILLAEIQLKNNTLARHQDLINHMRSVNSVAIHIRRGDLVESAHYRQNVGTLTPHYYQAAINQIITAVPHAHLFVFTEDISWAKTHICSNRPTTILSEQIKTNEAEDLMLMSFCRHFIIANSTFSWWGAWLSQHSPKIVITPSLFFRTPKPHQADLLPISWRKIETELSDSV